ncbi:RTN3 [Lepeophtheirus salmonis]|uniref:RTN3 n=1 Tax=Lepeophtheirus salmonis TaxID=72036 RepID=A0A7R8CC29_LEPSM|nr:RTN3 [Lepeophtheirus salmonis]CAF2766862.1 RTN3 [Lepeophtheirus salmonis]
MCYSIPCCRMKSKRNKAMFGIGLSLLILGLIGGIGGYSYQLYSIGCNLEREKLLQSGAYASLTLLIGTALGSFIMHLTRHKALPSENSKKSKKGSLSKPLVDRFIKDLLYWENPRETGVVFGSVLVVLLAIKYIFCHICCGALAAINKTKGGHPFKPLLDKDISISEETALDYTLCFLRNSIIYRDNQKQIDEALKPFLLKVNELTSLIRSFTGKKKEQ